MMYFSEERCVMCGEIIPEGRMVCLRCEQAASEQADVSPGTEHRIADPGKHSIGRCCVFPG